MKATVLVVDDRVRPRRALASELQDAGFGVVQAGDGEEAWECFCQGEPDVVVTDLVMPRADGHELLGRIRARSDVPVILFSAQASMAAAVSALKAGADDFVSSSDVEVEDIVSRVATAAEGRRRGAGEQSLATRIVGRSLAIQRVRARVMGLAQLSSPVLVVGEEGTGRDTVVKALHDLGSGAATKLVVIDCASYAVDRGLPECKAVYLDGVERLSPNGQEYWSRRLMEWESRQFRSGPRVFGSSAPIFRSVNQVPFHAYLRPLLLRFSLDLPPLRERPEDVPDLAEALVKSIASDMGRKTSLSSSAREFLGQQVWPRNITQLARLLEQAVAFSCERSIRRDELADLVRGLDDSVDAIRKHHGLRERDNLLETLQATGGNVSRTAERLGKSRGAIYRLIQKHGIPLSRTR
jgi:two-component system response regulator AtoC